MTKLHEILAVEDTVVSAAKKLVAETAGKFSRHTEFFTGTIRTLKRLTDSPADKAMEEAAKKVKELPTDVPSTLSYVFPFLDKGLHVKMVKHLTNQLAKADIVLGNEVLMKDVPVDFLLDLERLLPEWRAMYAVMPTLDPSYQWVSERKGVWKLKESVASAQTEKIMHPVVLAPATDKHPAQVKESTKDVVVGTFHDMTISGAATTQQKADAMKLCDELLAAVKQARMRANSVEIAKPDTPVSKITERFAAIFTK
jgi:hypothetical protein